MKHFYVIILAFIIGYSALRMRHLHSEELGDDDDDSSLEKYAEELQQRFKQHVGVNEEKKEKIEDTSEPQATLNNEETHD